MWTIGPTIHSSDTCPTAQSSVDPASCCTLALSPTPAHLLPITDCHAPDDPSNAFASAQPADTENSAFVIILPSFLKLFVPFLIFSFVYFFFFTFLYFLCRIFKVATPGRNELAKFRKSTTPGRIWLATCTRPFRGQYRSHTPEAASSLRTRAERPSSRGTDSSVTRSPAERTRCGGRANPRRKPPRFFCRCRPTFGLLLLLFGKSGKLFFFATLSLL